MCPEFRLLGMPNGVSRQNGLLPFPNKESLQDSLKYQALPVQITQVTFQRHTCEAACSIPLKKT